MRTDIAIAVSDHTGGLGLLVAATAAMTSLERIATGVFKLNGGIRRTPDSMIREQLSKLGFSRTANQIVAKGVIELSADVTPRDLLGKVELAMSPDIIAAQPVGPQRSALILINNALAGTTLHAEIRLGSQSIRLKEPMRAAPVQKGLPWSGTLVGIIECHHFLKRRVDIGPLDDVADGCHLVVVGTGTHQPFFGSLSPDESSAPIFIAGEGTRNGTTLRIPHPTEVRFATREETPSRMPLVRR